MCKTAYLLNCHVKSKHGVTEVIGVTEVVPVAAIVRMKNPEENTEENRRPRLEEEEAKF